MSKHILKYSSRVNDNRFKRLCDKTNKTGEKALLLRDFLPIVLLSFNLHLSRLISALYFGQTPRHLHTQISEQMGISSFLGKNLMFHIFYLQAFSQTQPKSAKSSISLHDLSYLRSLLNVNPHSLPFRLPYFNFLLLLISRLLSSFTFLNSYGLKYHSW